MTRSMGVMPVQKDLYSEKRSKSCSEPRCPFERLHRTKALGEHVKQSTTKKRTSRQRNQRDQELL